MAAGLVVPNSGPYIGTWHAFPLGTLSDDGYEISATVQGQEVNETDAFGMTLVEAIYRGANWECRLRGLEWKQGLLDSWQMFGQTAPNTLQPTLSNIGDRWTKFCNPMVLTSILGNPPCSPQSLTATNAGIKPNSQAAFNSTSKVKELPLTYVFIPYATGSPAVNVPFTTT
jgi:hypothetical protein